MPNPPGRSPRSARSTALRTTSSGLLEKAAWLETVPIESGSRVAEVIDDRPGRPGRGHFDGLFLVEARAVLHRVHEHFPERRDQQVAILAAQQ